MNMPGVVASETRAHKRKRVPENGTSHGVKARKAPRTKSGTSDDAQDRILLLEEQILESRQHYNNIVTLQEILNNVEDKPETALVASVALCRVFCRLIATEQLVKHNGASEADAQVTQWLRSRLRDYVESLSLWIGCANAMQESTALTLLMRIVKEEATGVNKKADHQWRNEKSTFVTTIRALVSNNDAADARQTFTEKYLEEHDDIRFYSFVAIKQCLQGEGGQRKEIVGNAIDVLSQIEGVPESEDELEDWYGDAPSGDKHQLSSLSAHRKVAREAWIAVFRSRLTFEHRHKIVGITATQILPWFTGHVELLADFLTDSFDHGGSMSLLALSGIFHLITQKNLDYPDFYTKLYSLLDDDLLHSKYRNRFFRLFETFLQSTHLPAAMIASFIKRLSRLALKSPPGGIVWIIPWTYNMLKQHPLCTFMLHRTYHPVHRIYAENPKYEEEGMDDPFDMNQADPMLTGAIDSSLWELETLQSHYHPNVATLAKIMGEQFTKRNYQLEDFLDHSYASLVDAELGKEMKKAPVVEWQIPKKIVTTETGELNEIGTMLQAAIDER